MADELDISPLLTRTTGPEFAASLRQRLEELAAKTDDPAYADRLREIAAGKRPLRTLAADPAWIATLPDKGASPQTRIEISGEQRADDLNGWQSPDGPNEDFHG